MEMASFGGILCGTDQIIDRHLLGSNHDPKRSFRHKRVALDLIKSPQGFQAQAMLKELVEQIRLNPKKQEDQGQSSENWREEQKPEYHPKNESDETRLERNIVKALKKAERFDWWNQMPIVSGLAGKHADRRRAIDLVHRRTGHESHYYFVELKVDSDTPLFALMEIVLYGLVYLVLRKVPEVSKGAKMFAAQDIGLRVLAPKEYFKRFALGWLERELNEALPKIVEEFDFGEQFRMTVSSHWPSNLKIWDDGILANDSDLLSCLEDWQPAFP
jgi:hypothetical protein